MPVGAVGLNYAMEIQTFKPGKCSLTLDACRPIQGTQQTDFPPDATTTFSLQLALSANEAWEKTISFHSRGPHKFPNSS
jgi:hypothetical protein